MTDVHEQKDVPAAAMNGEPAVVGELSEADALLLTEARTAKWVLEQFEFAYDARIRAITQNRVYFEFLAILVAVSFLFAQYVVKEYAIIHEVLGYIGTALSILVICMVIWGYINRWPDQIEKKRDLSREIRELLIQHTKLTTARPVDHAKIHKWLQACLEFEERRKHELATVPVGYMQCGYRHVGNTYPFSGVKCKKCNREWSHDMNQKTFSWWCFWKKTCDSCGVQL